MKHFIAFVAVASLMATAADAQPRRLVQNETLQREAVAAWTKCLADENSEEVAAILTMDFRTDEYREALDEMSDRRVSSNCYNALPRRYRRIELGGLPFAGGLAERMIETGSQEPLVMQLSMAAIGNPAETYSYTDASANCVVRGAPHLAAGLFESEIGSDEEVALLEQISAVMDVCTRGGNPIEAGALAMRSMLATASYRILAAQDTPSEESEEDA